MFAPHYGFLSAGSIGQESAFHRPVALPPSQRYVRAPPLCSSARYRRPEGLHTPVPVVLKYYTAPSSAVTPTPPMCYRWKMFADNWSTIWSARFSDTHPPTACWSYKFVFGADSGHSQSTNQQATVDYEALLHIPHFQQSIIFLNVMLST